MLERRLDAAVDDEEAIVLADKSSEIIEIARAGVTRANGQQKVAGSLLRPPRSMIAC